MKKILIMVIFLGGWTIARGQSPETLEKIEAAKIALITERLNLTPEQAEKFWPVYKEFTNKQLELRNEFQELKQGYNPQSATEEENKRMLERGMEIKERQLSLEKSYAERFQQVISVQQLLSLRKAEEDFREMLMQRIRQQRQQRNQLRQQKEDSRQKRQNN